MTENSFPFKNNPSTPRVRLTYSERGMTRRWFQFVVLCLLAIATITPLLEIFDRWDVIADPWNDTEMGVTALFLGISIAVTIACLVRLTAICSLSCIFLGLLQPTENRVFATVSYLQGVHFSLSPPIPLRI
jgi:hypothetical protein